MQSVVHSVDFLDSLSASILHESKSNHRGEHVIQSSSKDQSLHSGGDETNRSHQGDETSYSISERDRLVVKDNSPQDETMSPPLRRKPKWKRELHRKSSSGNSGPVKMKKEISSSTSFFKQSNSNRNKNGQQRLEEYSKLSSLSEQSPSNEQSSTNEEVNLIKEQQPSDDNANANANNNESSPRYGRRFRFSKRFVKMQKLEAVNETYYPPDHIRDGNLWVIKKELNLREKGVVESLRDDLQPFIPRYENLSRYLDLSYQLKQSITQEEWDKLKSIKDGEKKSKYRAQLNGRIQEEQRRRDRSLAKLRKKLLMKETVMVEYVRENEHGYRNGERIGGNHHHHHQQQQQQQSIWICEGCSFKEKMFDYAVKKENKMAHSGDGIILRKFVGNREVDEIFTNDYGKCGMEKE